MKNTGKKNRIVLIVGGGIAAYKSLDLVRHLRRAGVKVECVLTASAKKFVRPLSFASLSGNAVRSELFNDQQEAEMDHIALSRSADLLLVAPATANLLAKMAQGLADDLATTLLLATDTPVLCAPAMNWRMWAHEATKRNVRQLKQDGIFIVEPDVGEMACGEYGAGRLPHPEQIAAQALALLNAQEKKHPQPLAGRKFLLTSGATREALDPVRFISNHSSGKQGLALAEELVAQGGEVFLVEGFSETPPPQKSIHHIKIQTASEMKTACEQILLNHKIDSALCVAAVCDWKPATPAQQKIKKPHGIGADADKSAMPTIEWEENPDVLAFIANHTTKRPALVIGFAAETENLLENARRKKEKKKCDWIVANDVSKNVFGADENQIILLRGDKEIALPQMSKTQIAKTLAAEIANKLTRAPAAIHTT